MLLAVKERLARRGVDFRSASVLSRARPMSRFTHLRSLQGLICDANPLGVALAPLQSTCSTNVNYSRRVGTFILTVQPLLKF